MAPRTGKRASKEELDKRRARQKEVKQIRESREKKKPIEKREISRPKKPAQTAPSIELKPEKKGLGLKEIAKKAIGIEPLRGEGGVPVEPIGSPLPIAPAASVGALLGGGEVVGAGIKVSQAALKTIRSRLAVSKLTGKATTTAAREIPGKFVAATGRNAAIAGRFASNSKSSSLTKKVLIGAGLSLGVASITKDLLGTYPFASFAKEETLQVVNFPISRAIEEGLFEEAQELLNFSNELVEATPDIIDKIPYANVQREFKRYAEAQAKANKVWGELIEKKRGEVGQESDFARERREGDEAAFERKREFADEESERFEGIRSENEARDEERETERTATREAEATAESERFAGIQEERRQGKLAEARMEQEFSRLIGLKRYAEANALKVEFFENQ